VTFSSLGSSGGQRVLSPPDSPLVGDTLTVVVDRTTTYVLTVTGPGGTARDSVTVVVSEPIQPEPTARVAVTPSRVARVGESVMLTLGSEYADSALLETIEWEGDTRRASKTRFQTGGDPLSVVLPERIARRTEFRFTSFNSRGASATATTSVDVPEAPEAWIVASLGGDSVVVRSGAEGSERGSLTRRDLPTDVGRPALDSMQVQRGTSGAYVYAVSGPGGTDSATVVVVDREAPADPSGWWWGPGLGGAVITGATSFAIPFLVVSGGPSKHWYGTLQVGLRPAVGEDSLPSSDPGVATGDRRYKIATFGVVGFPTGSWWGGSLAYAAAWETISGLDYYVRRAHGPSAGVRGRWPADDEGLDGFHVVFGADVLYTNVSHYDETVSEWKFGAAPSIVLTFPFG
jgi:hypothetical protein